MPTPRTVTETLNIYNYEVKHQHVLAKKDISNNENWTRCKISEWEVVKVLRIE